MRAANGRSLAVNGFLHEFIRLLLATAFVAGEQRRSHSQIRAHDASFTLG
jgi:hypothetical protein